ncbi:reverse transcriptase domain-containing protein [Tanacetum coccineum]
MDRFKSESSHIKGVPPVLRIPAFMHGHGYLELAKKLNDKIPKTLDEMFKRVRAFIRGEVATRSAEMVRPSQGDKGYIHLAWTGGPEKARNRGGPREAQRNMGVYTPYPRKDTFTLLIKTPKEILAMESVSFPELPPLIGTPEKQNLNKFCYYHGDRGHNTNDCYQLKKQIEEVVASGKLAHLNQLTDEPIILEGIIEANQIRRILVECGSSSEIMYEHCFRGLNVNIRLRLKRCKASMVGFSGETYHPLGVKDLRVTMGRAGRNKTVLMKFAIIKCPSPYNVIIGRTGMRSLRAVGSTIYSMIKFPTNQEIVTMETSREALRECKHLERVQGSWKEEGEKLASLMGYPYKCFLRLLKEYSQIRMAEDDEENTRFHIEEGVYCFTHMPKELHNSAATLQRMMKKVLADQRGRNVEIFLEEIVIKSKNKRDLVQDVEETLRKLKRVNIKIDPITSSFRVKEGRFLGYILTKEGEGEALMICLRQRNETISSVLLVEREGIQIPVSYVSRPLQGMEICYTLTKNMAQALIHTTRSLRAIFRKHKVKVVTDGPMEEILNLNGRKRRLAKWVAEVQTYDISYTQRKEAKGSIVKKFLGQGEQIQETPDENEGETFNLSKKLQAKSTPTLRAWRLYLGKETIEEGSGMGIILVSPNEKMHSHAIHLKFNASDHAIDCEAVLAGLATSVSKGMKDLHVFMDSPKLVAQTEGNHTPATEQEKRYKKEIMEATTPFHKLRIIHLLKNLNPKAEVLTGLATLKLELLN